SPYAVLFFPLRRRKGRGGAVPPRLGRRRGRGLLAEGLKPLTETAGVGLLRPRQGFEPLGDLIEPFLAGGPGESGVHLGVLVALAGHRGLEVLLSVTDRRAGRRVAGLFEKVEVPEGVAGLRLGGVAEQAADVGVAFDVGAPGEIQVAAVRLRFADKG